MKLMPGEIYTNLLVKGSVLKISGLALIERMKGQRAIDSVRLYDGYFGPFADDVMLKISAIDAIEINFIADSAFDAITPNIVDTVYNQNGAIITAVINGVRHDFDYYGSRLLSVSFSNHIVTQVYESGKIKKSTG